MHQRKKTCACIYIFISLFFILQFKISFSQEAGYYNYTIKEGLPSQVVYCIHQDYEGYIWFGTDAGLCRFDGRTFENYSMDDGLSDNEILRIFEDSRHRLWFFTLNGNINYYYKGKIYNPKNSKMLLEAHINSSYLSFVEDGNGNLWFGTFAGEVLKITPDSNLVKFDLGKIYQDPVYGRIFIALNEKDELCLTFGNDIMELNSGKMIIRNLNKEINIYASQNPGVIVFEDENGLMSLCRGKKELLIPASKVPSDLLRIYIDSQQNVSLLTRSNLLIEYKKSGNSYHADSIRLKSQVSQVWRDRDGNTWYTTLGSGIYMRPRREVSSYSFDKNHFLLDDNILTLLPMSDNRVIAGFNSGGMQMIENNSVVPGYLEQSLVKKSRIMQLYDDKRGRIWIATDLGARSFSSDVKDKVAVEKYMVRTISENKVLAAMKDVTSSSTGDVVFAEADGLYILPGGKGEIFGQLAAGVIARQRISTVFYDHADNLWFANNDGLCKYRNGKLIAMWEKSTLLSGKITDIKETLDSVLLVASLGKGIVLIKNDSIIGTISTGNGLESNYVRCITMDDSLVYLGTNRGISRLQIKGNTCLSLSNYGYSSGLISEDVNAVAMSSKYIYVATSQGLTVLERPLKVSPLPAPMVYIKSLKIDDQLVDPTIRFNVPYNFRSIAIDFSSPVYINADKVKFRYRFTGSQNWAVTLSNKIDLYGLQNGKYAFEVQSKRSDSNWGPVTVLQFTVMPPFWKTWWFIFVLSTVMVTISYFIIRRIVTRKLRERIRVLNEQQALELERRRISSDMHDDLGADLTNIVIMSRVARQTAVTASVDYTVLQNIEQASNDVINKMNEIIWALNPGNDTLDNLIAYLRNYANAFCELHNIELLFASTSFSDVIDIKASFRRNIFLSVKESLRNITRHAAATKANIKITVDLQHHSLEICIEDNGTGIVENNKKSYFAGNGLVNIKKRMREISGTFDISSVNGSGTAITLKSYF